MGLEEALCSLKDCSIGHSPKARRRADEGDKKLSSQSAHFCSVTLVHNMNCSEER